LFSFTPAETNAGKFFSVSRQREMVPENSLSFRVRGKLCWKIQFHFTLMENRPGKFSFVSRWQEMALENLFSIYGSGEAVKVTDLFNIFGFASITNC
jgi:hypothetical protein